MKKKEVATDTTEIQRIILDDCERLYATKFNDLEEMDNFLKYICNLPRLNHEEIGIFK